MMKSFLVLASAGALTIGIPLTGMSGSTAVTAGAQGRLQQWMRQVSLDVSLSSSARINVMLKAANQDGITAVTAIGKKDRGMAYQEASAMAKAMMVAETWWQRDHLQASSSDAAGLKTSLDTLATVKTTLAADGWWKSQSQLARSMTAAWVKGSALLTTPSASTLSSKTDVQSSAQWRRNVGRVTHTSTSESHQEDQNSLKSHSVVKSSASGATTSSSSSSTHAAPNRQMTVRPHNGFEANLGLSANAGAQVGTRDNLSPAASHLQGQTNASLDAGVNVLGQLGL